MEVQPNPLRSWIAAQIERGGETIDDLSRDLATSRANGLDVPRTGAVRAEVAAMEDAGLVSISDTELVTIKRKKVIKQSVLF